MISQAENKIIKAEIQAELAEALLNFAEKAKKAAALEACRDGDVRAKARFSHLEDKVWELEDILQKFKNRLKVAKTNNKASKDETDSGAGQSVSTSPAIMDKAKEERRTAKEVLRTAKEKHLQAMKRFHDADKSCKEMEKALSDDDNGQLLRNCVWAAMKKEGFVEVSCNSEKGGGPGCVTWKTNLFLRCLPEYKFICGVSRKEGEGYCSSDNDEIPPPCEEEMDLTVENLIDILIKGKTNLITLPEGFEEEVSVLVPLMRKEVVELCKKYLKSLEDRKSM
jgi:hypothetical protein